MSFDLLIVLIIVVATLVQAVARMRQGRGQGEPRQGPPAGRPPREAPAQDARPAGRPEPRRGPPGDASFGDRLEEARRRVQDAMSGGEAVPGSRTARSAEELGTLVSERPARATPQRAPQGLEGRSLEGASLEGISLEGPGLGRTGSLRTDLEKDVGLASAPPMRVQRTFRKKTARLSGSELINLDATSIFQGVIWHQILSDPLSKRNRRRRLSRRP